jgi:hypothetical protein
MKSCSCGKQFFSSVTYHVYTMKYNKEDQDKLNHSGKKK